MKFNHLLIVPCLMTAVSCFSVENFKSCIDKSVQIGAHPKISKDVTIEANAVIGNFVTIGAHTLIEQNTNIGDYVSVGKLCNIKENSTLESYVSLGKGNKIGSMNILRSYCSTGRGVVFMNRVTANEYSTIDRFVTVGNDAILDQFSNIGSIAKIKQNVYIGKGSTVGTKATVNELAVIHKNVDIPRAKKVDRAEVVIQTPSSIDLYSICSEYVSHEQAEIAKPTEDGSKSARFNDLMRHLIDDELNGLSGNCTKASIPMKPVTLSQIISLYLIHYHGLERFKELVNRVKHPNASKLLIEFVNNKRCDDSCKDWYSELENEFHFGSQSTRDFLETDVKQKLVQLLVTAQDAERDIRVKGDDFCTMFNEIRSEKRKLSFSKRKKYCKPIMPEYE